MAKKKAPPVFKEKMKLFVVRKYVKAKSVADALKRERKYQPDECFLHDGWASANLNHLESAIGFEVEYDDYEDDEFEYDKR